VPRSSPTRRAWDRVARYFGEVARFHAEILELIPNKICSIQDNVSACCEREPSFTSCSEGHARRCGFAFGVPSESQSGFVGSIVLEVFSAERMWVFPTRIAYHEVGTVP
jgi:hypothetical protein